jgi:hypothetical protein
MTAWHALLSSGLTPGSAGWAGVALPDAAAPGRRARNADSADSVGSLEDREHLAS